MRKNQEYIIRELGVKPTIDTKKELCERINFLSEYLGNTGMKGYVLGISGGQDSLLAGIMAQRAVEANRDRGLEAEFHGILLPYGTQKDRDDALLALDIIKPDRVHDLNIKPATDAFAESYETSTGTALHDFHKGNVKARMRMIAHYAIAGEHDLLVLGTDHAAEAVTGFYTKYGDGGADVLPLAGLTKGQGRDLMCELLVPERFMHKAPTADLLDGTPAQADETELGISYGTIDAYLRGEAVTDEDAEKIEARYLATTHKRSMPVGYTDYEAYREGI